MKLTEGQPIVIEADREKLTEGPSKEEIMEIIRGLANGKAAGRDGLRNEYIKYANNETGEELYKIIKKVWETNDIPSQWKQSTQIPIPKCKTPKETKDFRRISLCNLGYKIYAKWLMQRLREYAGDPDYHQAAFTKDRSTDDQMFYARRFLDERWNGGETTIVAAIDLRKAFDNVDITTVPKILTKLAVPDHITNRVMQALNAEKTCILWEGICTEERIKAKGIKQGCPLSPYIFTLIIQDILREIKKKYPKINLLEPDNDKLPVIIVFADDILIIAKSLKEIEDIVKILKTELEKIGLEVNNNKSQIMIREPISDRNIPKQVNIDGEDYEVVNNMRYLGTYLSDTLDRPQTSRKRCKLAIGSSKIMIEFLRRYKPPWSLAKLMYKTVISPAITYGLKTATLIKRNRKSITKYEMQILKEMIKYCKDRPKGRLTASKLLDGKTAVKKIMVMRINYWGHIQRRVEGHPLKIAQNLRCKKKKIGRPAKTWNEAVREDKDRLPNITEEDWNRIVKDKYELKRQAELIYKTTDSEEESESGVDE